MKILSTFRSSKEICYKSSRVVRFIWHWKGFEMENTDKSYCICVLHLYLTSFWSFFFSVRVRCWANFSFRPWLFIKLYDMFLFHYVESLTKICVIFHFMFFNIRLKFKSAYEEKKSRLHKWSWLKKNIKKHSYKQTDLVYAITRQGCIL